jgi:RNA polymerase sigma-70 factor (ECF subfamily)
MRALSEQTDAELARSITERAPAALAKEGELCRRMAPRIRAYGLRHLRSSDLAADLVQRVLVLTIEKLRAGDVRDPERIASFVLGVARVSAQRTALGLKRESPLAELSHLEDTFVDDTGARLEKRLAPCFEGLAAREKTVLLLTYFEDRSAPEIAERIGTTQGNVRIVRHRALERLRGCLELEAAS